MPEVTGHDWTNIVRTTDDMHYNTNHEATIRLGTDDAPEVHRHWAEGAEELVGTVSTEYNFHAYVNDWRGFIQEKALEDIRDEADWEV